MDFYVCNFVDHGRNIRSTESFYEAHDEAAIRRAMDLNVETLGAGFELWQGSRQVFTHKNKAR